MTPHYVVSGTDTGIGKTVFSAALAGALGGSYWKAIQSGLAEETDSAAVLRLGALKQEQILPEAYCLQTPASPHLSAGRDGIEIDPARLEPPQTRDPLVIEGAGGLPVPITEEVVFADIFAHWQIPVILCARTSLGTINHTLLSVQALRHRGIPVAGIAFIGDENRETQRVIAKMGCVAELGRLPWLPDLNAAALRAAFCENFDLAYLRGGLV